MSRVTELSPVDPPAAASRESRSRSLFVVAAVASVLRVAMWIWAPTNGFPEHPSGFWVIRLLDFGLYGVAIVYFIFGLKARRRERNLVGAAFDPTGLIVVAIVVLIPLIYVATKSVDASWYSSWQLLTPEGMEPDNVRMAFAVLASAFSPFLGDFTTGIGYISWPIYVLASTALIAFGIAFSRRWPSSRLALSGGDAQQTGVVGSTSDAGHTNGLALASIIVVWFSSIIGLILGLVALSQIKRTAEHGRGMALAAVIAGSALTGLSVILGIVYVAIVVSALNVI